MKVRLRTNLVSGIFFFILAIVIWLFIPIQVKLVETTAINAQTFPRIVTIVLFISSLILIASDVIKIKNKKQTEVIEFEIKKELLVGVLFGILFGYALIMPRIGYLFASIVMSVSMLAFFKVRNWKYYGIVIVSCIIISYVFKDLLLVQLP